MSFESDIERVEAIVEALEQEELDLDGALRLFQEGVERLRSAAAAVAHAEEQLRVLLPRPDGSLDVADFPG